MSLPEERAYGVVIVLKEKEYKFLILKQHEGSWTFPKGHHEGNETSEETARRELKEETGITEVQLLEFPLIHEEYEINFENRVLKINEYFIGFVKSTDVTIQEEELVGYEWATYEEALEKFIYPQRKESLRKAKEYLDKISTI